MNRTARRALMPVTALAFAAVLSVASGASAQRYYEHPHEYGDGDPHWGPYFAAGVGGGLQLTEADDGKLAGEGEVRLGFSFGRRFQLYIDGDLSAASHDYGTVSASDIMLGIRYFLYADPFVGVYARAGIGVGIVSGNSLLGESDPEYGIAESYGLGMEFRLGGKWALSPELFYRRTNETDDTRVDTLGLGLLINFN